MTRLISNQVPEQQNKDLINGLIYILNDTPHATDNFFYNFKNMQDTAMKIAGMSEKILRHVSKAQLCYM